MEEAKTLKEQLLFKKKTAYEVMTEEAKKEMEEYSKEYMWYIDHSKTEREAVRSGIALFEKREGKHIFPANRYFRSDYISGRILRSFFAYTVCFILCALMWVLYSMERLLNVMELDEVVGAAKAGAVLYAAGLVLYLIITWLVSSKRYEYARRGMRVYIAKLKRLEKRYDVQSRTRELTKEGSRYDDVSRT